MNKRDMKRAAKVAINNLLDSDPVVAVNIDVALTEIELELIEAVQYQNNRIKRLKPSPLTAEVKNNLDEFQKQMASDLVTGRYVLSYLSAGVDPLDLTNVTEELLRFDTNSLEQLTEFGREGYSAESLAHHFELTVEDVQVHLKAQGIK